MQFRRAVIAIALAGATTSCSPPADSPGDTLVVTPAATRAAPTGVVLTHDFGVLKPGSEVRHEFTLRNDTAADWTFDQFRTTCGCTVAAISDGHIPAGGATTITVHYKCPSTVGDDRRGVGVILKESAAPPVNLVIACKVREPVSLFPILLRVEAAPDKPAKAEIEVCSYVPELTAAPALAAGAAWVAVGVPEPLAIPPDEPTMARRWRVPLTLAADTLGPGDYRCELAIPPAAKHGAGVRVPVELKVTAPVAVTPGQLFFGTLKVGEGKSVTVSVRTPKGHPASGVSCTHDLGDALKIETVSATPVAAVLRATLTPGKAGAVNGTVRVGVDGLPPTKLPVLARVQAHAN